MSKNRKELTETRQESQYTARDLATLVRAARRRLFCPEHHERLDDRGICARCMVPVEAYTILAIMDPDLVERGGTIKPDNRHRLYGAGLGVDDWR